MILLLCNVRTNFVRHTEIAIIHLEFKRYILVWIVESWTNESRIHQVMMIDLQ